MSDTEIHIGDVKVVEVKVIHFGKFKDNTIGDIGNDSIIENETIVYVHKSLAVLIETYRRFEIHIHNLQGESYGTIPCNNLELVIPYVHEIVELTPTQKEQFINAWDF